MRYKNIGKQISSKGAAMAESRNNYKKTDIKLNLINALRSNYMTKEDIRNFLTSEYKRLGKVPANSNFNDYKVSERTVRREIESIQSFYGDQLEEKLGVYKLDLRDFPDTIEDTEIQALDVAIQKMKNNVNARNLLETLKSKLTTRLYRKIKNTEPKIAEKKINAIDEKINSNYAFVGPRLIVKFDEKIKNALESAISKQHEVRFKYYEKETTICPLGIIDGPNNVYLIAYECKDANACSEPQHYILSEISNLTETQNWFARDDKFSIKEYAESMFGIYHEDTIYDVEWLIRNPKTINIAKKYLFHPTQKFIDNPDGSLTVRMHTGGLRAISVFLTTWNGDIIPVKPKELLIEYRDLLKRCEESIQDL